jgi:hypothetical protein
LNVSLDFINHTQLGTQLQAFSYSHEIISWFTWYTQQFEFII